METTLYCPVCGDPVDISVQVENITKAPARLLVTWRSSAPEHACG